MRKRSRKRRDFNEIAFDVVARATGQVPPAAPESPVVAAARVLGRLGGLKGGVARAAKLSKAERSKIAKKAARARWKKKAEESDAKPATP